MFNHAMYMDNEHHYDLCISCMHMYDCWGFYILAQRSLSIMSMEMIFVIDAAA